MKAIVRTVVVSLGAFALAAPLAAQIGQLDQVSPLDPAAGANASFNEDVDFLMWQQQIRCGIAGQLEGIRLGLNGNAGAGMNVRIRMGPAHSDQEILFETVVVKALSGVELVFVDMTDANIVMNVDDLFVLDTNGTNTGMSLNGSYVAPPGAPLYPEPLFLNGANFADGGWRHGFETYVINGEEPCDGDVDGDGTVGLADLATLLAHFGTLEGASRQDGDLDADGDVDLTDLAILLANFGTVC